MEKTPASAGVLSPDTVAVEVAPEISPETRRENVRLASNAIKVLRSHSALYGNEIKDLFTDFLIKGMPKQISDQKKNELFTKKRRELRPYAEERDGRIVGLLENGKSAFTRIERKPLGLAGMGRDLNIEALNYTEAVANRFLCYLASLQHWTLEAIRFKDAKKAEVAELGIIGWLGRMLNITQSPITRETFEFRDYALPEPEVSGLVIPPETSTSAVFAMKHRASEAKLEEYKTIYAEIKKEGSLPGITPRSASRLDGGMTPRGTGR